MILMMEDREEVGLPVYQKLVKLVNKCSLSNEETLLLAALAEAKSRGVECLKGREILSLVYGDGKLSGDRMKQLLGPKGKLRKLGLLISQGISDKKNLRERTFTLSWSAVDELISDEEMPSHEEGTHPESCPSINSELSALTPYRDNREYLADQLQRVRLYERRKDLTFARNHFADFDMGGRRRRDPKLIDSAIERSEDRMRVRLGMTKVEFPLERWRRIYQLSEKEVLALLACLSHHLRNEESLYQRDLLRWVSRDEVEVMDNRKILYDDAPLLRNNILSTEGGRFYGRGVRVNEDRLDQLLGDKPDIEDTDGGESDTFVELQKLCTGKFFELIRPAANLQNVILAEPVRQEIGLVFSSLRRRTQKTLRTWGVSTGKLRPGGDCPTDAHSLTLLLLGEPGTGKTLTAEAVAHQLNRPMLSVDCSRVVSCWVGESQKNAKRIFDEYEEIRNDSEPEPILFLDEVDQLFSMRTDVMQSSDRMYNQMQNILLQSLDNFKGVLVATTNLVENLDPAFSRRFQFKIEFQRPDARARLRLWGLHLADAPLAKGIDLPALAQGYDLSGGQIALSAKNAALRAAARRPKQRLITQDDLESAIEAELSASFEYSVGTPIGFRP